MEQKEVNECRSRSQDMGSSVSRDGGTDSEHPGSRGFCQSLLGESGRSEVPLKEGVNLLGETCVLPFFAEQT